MRRRSVLQGVAVGRAFGAGYGGHHGSLLDVGAEPDGDGEAGVGAYDGVVPDGGFVPVGHVADYGGRGCHEGVVRFEGDVVEEGHFGTVSGEYLETRFTCF